jgi:O-antigen/teichoic acid export membrane protein
MTGTTIAQAIPIAISPILTRLYTPEDFGVFALYMGVVSIIAAIITGGYEHAIMLPKKESDAKYLVILSLIITFLITLFIFIIILIFNKDIADILGNKAMSNWLFFIPIPILFSGIYQSFNYWHNRNKNYKKLANSKVGQSFTTSFTNLSLGFSNLGSLGLILGTIIGQLIGVYVLIKKSFLFKIETINKLKLFLLAKKYINFLKFSTFSSVLNSLSFNLFTILLAKLYSSSILGFYHLVFRILTMPATLIGSSISQVYFEESTRQKNMLGNNHKIFKNTLKKLFLISFIIYFPMYFYIEDLIVFIFGIKWKISGEIAKTLIPLMFIRFVSSILSSTLTTYEKQKVGLLINFTLALNIIILVIIAKIYNHNYIVFFYNYMISTSILYFLFLVYYYKLSKGEHI